MAKSPFLDYASAGFSEIGSTESSNPGQVTFTQHQLDLLEKVFPEVAAGSDSMSDASVRYCLGQRAVVAFVRDRTRR